MFKNLFSAIFLFLISLLLRAFSGYTVNDSFPQLFSDCLSVIVTVLPFYVYNRISKTKQTKTVSFEKIYIVPIFFSALLLANAGAYIENVFMEFLKITPQHTDISALGLFDLWAFIIFSAVIVPLSEEYVYRKSIMKILSPYGILPSVIISSLMFSLAHPFGTRVYAFFMGTALGLIFVCSGIKHSIVFHILNNSLNIVFAVLQNAFGRKADICYNVFVLAAGALSMLLIIKKLFLKRGVGGGKET